MKQTYSLSLFVIGVLFAFTFQANLKLSASLNQMDIETLRSNFNELFTQPRSEDCGKVDLPAQRADSAAPVTPAKKSGWGPNRPTFEWSTEKWGFGKTAYLIDYLEDVFLKDFIDETLTIIRGISKFKRDADNYVDPFNMKDLTKDDPTKDNMGKINPDWNFEVWQKSISAGQINQALKSFSWFYNSNTQDPAKDFILKYDKDGDGRLNIKELIIAIIWTNKARSTKCYNCYFYLAQKIRAVFTYIDCSGSGIVNSEQCFDKLRNLKRSANAKCDIFLGPDSKKRTDAINDFVLKNSFKFDGALISDEFTNGILLALTDRHVSLMDVTPGDYISMKSKRC
jgi:hypothetical protein